MGTASGLARFDGKAFFCYTKKTNPELIGDRFLHLAEDRSGTLWAVTSEQVVRLKNGRFEPVDIGGLRADEVINLYATSDGSVWFGLWSGLKRCRDGVVSTWTREEITRSPGLNEDAAGRLWVSGNGIASIDLHDPNTKPRMQRGDIPGIDTDWSTRDTNGTLWLGLEDFKMVHRWKDEKWEELTASFSPPVPVGARAVADANGNLWFHTRSRLICYSISTLEAVEERALNIQCLLCDREGNIWIGSDAGLFLRPNHRIKTLALESVSGAETETWNVFQSRENDIWVGTRSNLLRLRDQKVQRYTFNSPQFHPPASLSLPIRAIGQGSGPDIWAASRFYLYRLHDWTENEPRQVQIFYVPADFTSISATPDGQMRFGNFSDLIVKDNRLHPLGRDISLPDTHYYISIFHTRSGETWCGTEALGLFRRRAGQLTNFTTKDGLPSNYAAVVHEDESGALWILSDRGVGRFKNGRFSWINDSNGFPGQSAFAMLDDQLGNYWFNTQSGICRIAGNDLNNVADGLRALIEPQVYGIEEGAPSEIVRGFGFPNSCRTTDGRLWFPTARGVAIVDPARSGAFAPAVATIEQIRANDLPLLTEPLIGKKTNSFQIAPGHGSSLAIEYGALELTRANRITFAYRLVGHQDRWTAASQERLVRYTDLRPGRYEFQVKASDRFGPLNETVAVVSLTLQPFFHQTPLFRFGAPLGILTIITVAILQRFKTQRRILELEQSAALARERERIARDLHDDLGASLTRIALLSQVASRQIAQDENAATHVEKISEISDEVVDSIGSVVWAANPRYDNLESLVVYFREYAAEYLTALGIDLQFESSPGVLSQTLSGGFRREMFLVLKEALNNVGKHAHAGKVEIKLRSDSRQIMLSISDDGRGLGSDRKGSCQNGLVNMRDRIHRLGGEFAVGCSSAGGVQITVKAPLPELESLAK